jgi:hypothetical protein
MTYCPRCGASYEAGTGRCADCGVALVGEPPVRPASDPDAQERTALVHEARNELEAQMISQALEAEGIGHTTMSYVTESVFPFSDTKLARVRILVLEHDAEAARRIIAALEGGENPEPEDA